MKRFTEHSRGFSRAEIGDRGYDDAVDVLGQLRRRHARRASQRVELTLYALEEAQCRTRRSRATRPSRGTRQSRRASIGGHQARPGGCEEDPRTQGPPYDGRHHRGETDRRTLLEREALAFSLLAFALLCCEALAFPLLGCEALAFDVLVEQALDHAEK
jgi:hypothetical protein